MTIRVLVNGCHGKMGSVTVKTIEHHADFTLAGATGHHDHLPDAIKHYQPDVVIDFTNAQSARKNLHMIVDAGIHPVIGTSGFTQDDIAYFQERCAHLKLGGIIAPNFSIGAILMMKCARDCASYFSSAEIIEMHHAGKLDSPSGTALRTADLISKQLNQPVQPASKTIHETIPGARGASYEGIPIHAVRLPGVVAAQQVIFGGTGETLTIRHDTLDRECFMPGVILACQKVMGLQQLVYGLENII